jgi:hypothetical protein
MARSEPSPLLITAEAVAVLFTAAALAPPWSLIVLVAVGSASRWVRGLRWTRSLETDDEISTVDAMTVTTFGALTGAAALGIALLWMTPLLVEMSGRAIEWSSVPMVRGNVSALIAVATLVAAQVVASELVFRRWLLERVLDEVPQATTLAIAIAAVAEALVTPGAGYHRLGALIAGLGFGALYVGGGRRLAGPLACRLIFEGGALLFTWARLV